MNTVIATSGNIQQQVNLPTTVARRASVFFFFFPGGTVSSWRLWLWCVSSQFTQNLLHPSRWRRTWHGSHWSVSKTMKTMKNHQCLGAKCTVKLASMWTQSVSIASLFLLTTDIFSSTGRPTLPPSCRVTRWSPCIQSTAAARWAPSALPPGAQAPFCQSPGRTSRSVQIVSDLTKLHKMSEKGKISRNKKKRFTATQQCDIKDCNQAADSSGKLNPNPNPNPVLNLDRLSSFFHIRHPLIMFKISRYPSLKCKQLKQHH